MKIGGMGGFELIIILVVILIIFGPKNLPKLGNAIGKTLSNLRAGMSEGKKKGDAAKAEEAAPDDAAPAEIEGVVEEAMDVEEAEEAADDAEADAVAAAEAGEEDELIGDAQDAVAEAEGAADEAFQTRKVRRVVKKKVVSEEPVE